MWRGIMGEAAAALTICIPKWELPAFTVSAAVSHEGYEFGFNTTPKLRATCPL
jgi:hypothetical protein